MPGISNQMMAAKTAAFQRIYDKERAETVDISLTVEGEMSEEQKGVLTERIQSGLAEVHPKLIGAVLEQREDGYVLPGVPKLDDRVYRNLCYLAGHRASGVIDEGLVSVTLTENYGGKEGYTKTVTPQDLKADIKANIVYGC